MVIKEKTINNINLKLGKRGSLFVVVVKSGDFVLSNKSYHEEWEANLAYNEKLKAMKNEATRLSLRSKE